ncbi:MAG: class I SAM-dependent methyltransferase [Pseudomonadota bacterium]
MEYDRFSRVWYDTFLATVPEARTLAETAFVERNAPAARHRRLLDIACGPGRHASRLSELGYNVVGIDLDTASIAAATSKGIPDCTFKVWDMRQVTSLLGEFDVAISLWHSFGYYDDAANARILSDVASKLVHDGRLIVDIYNRDFMIKLPLEIEEERADRRFTTRRIWTGARMRCEIVYDDASSDVLDWRIFTPEEFAALAGENGFEVSLCCAQYDETVSPSPDHPGMQFVLAKASA